VTGNPVIFSFLADERRLHAKIRPSGSAGIGLVKRTPLSGRDLPELRVAVNVGLPSRGSVSRRASVLSSCRLFGGAGWSDLRLMRFAIDASNRTADVNRSA
jgi:hypothetical protein